MTGFRRPRDVASPSIAGLETLSIYQCCQGATLPHQVMDPIAVLPHQAKPELGRITVAGPSMGKGTQAGDAWEIARHLNHDCMQPRRLGIITNEEEGIHGLGMSPAQSRRRWEGGHRDSVNMEQNAAKQEERLGRCTTTIVTENSVSGSHMLRIECFSATKGLGLGNFIKSSPFIVGGHTWAIRYYPDGRDYSDIGKMSVDVCLDRPASTGGEQKRQCIKVPPPDLHSDLFRLLTTAKGGDVVFEVGGELFTAHRNVLAARSSVFDGEFFGPMKEKTGAHIRIDDMEPKVFRLLLRFVYTDTLPPMDAGEERTVMAQHLLVAADRYDLKRLKLICEDKLCDGIDIGTVATTMALAEQHSCPGLREACIDFISSPGNLKKIIATDGYQHLKATCPTFLEEMVGKLAN
ncbi:hypothetical protein HU200_044066 [Digitaria exilis]|uniref:Uncharacterized protein n=1 Tax=Digitaria exilis TaxID=1010633 RepID=A0A835EBH2_9POAL|nr:hypothetical protein HU200_044066 [Digitaria exilis]